MPSAGDWERDRCNEWDFGWIVPKHWENEVRDANRS